jgi:uncharacterized protein YvpB
MEMRRWCNRSVIVMVIVVLGAAVRPVAADELHTVAPGETVASIAAAHGSSVDAVITNNGITDVRNLRVSQQLVMPERQAPVITGVLPYQQQRPLSCEFASVYIATAIFGNPIWESVSIAATPLDPNPHNGFRGNIDGQWGNTDDYGVYAEALVANLGTHDFVGEVSYGADAASLRAQLDLGRPTIAWLGYWGETGSYETDSTGSTYKLVPGYHNVVAYGYDDNVVYIANPGTGTLETYSWDTFLMMWAVMDGMALSVYPA